MSGVYKPGSLVQDLHDVDYYGYSGKGFAPFTQDYAQYLHTISNAVLVIALIGLVLYTFMVYAYVFGHKKGHEISRFDCTLLTPTYMQGTDDCPKYNVTRIRSRGGRPLKVTLAVIFAGTFVLGLHAYQYQGKMASSVDSVRNSTLKMSTKFFSAQSNGR